MVQSEFKVNLEVAGQSIRQSKRLEEGVKWRWGFFRDLGTGKGVRRKVSLCGEEVEEEEEPVFIKRNRG